MHGRARNAFEIPVLYINVCISGSDGECLHRFIGYVRDDQRT